MDGSWGRRRFLATVPAMAALPLGVLPARTGATWPGSPVGPSMPPPRPDDEAFWYAVRGEFVTLGGVTHVNNGGVSARLDRVEAAQDLRIQHARTLPFYAYRSAHRPALEDVRAHVADFLGVPTTSLALTRNASAGMAALQSGFPLRAGSRVVLTEHAFPPMRDIWYQRARRESLVLDPVAVPVPFDPERFLDAYAAALDRGADLAMLTHVVDITGQVLPLADVLDLCEARAVPLIVDGAQAPGHLPRLPDIGRCAGYATCLHKWVHGPVGTGALFVHPEWIDRVDPLAGAPEELRDDVRKFEVDGAELWVKHLAVPEALDFHRSIGSDAVAGRLTQLRRHVEARIRAMPGSTILTDTTSGRAGAMLAFDLAGVPPRYVRDRLWERHRIRVRAIDQPAYRAVRLSPGLNVGPDDLDRLVQAVDEARSTYRG